ncbi:MAG: hypothetical protein ACTSWX_04275 [Promethearchaeota archaeon]
MDTKKKELLKYKLKLIINQHRIGTKPYILNTLGNLCEAFLAELKDIPKNEMIEIIIAPNEKENEKVKIKGESNNVSLEPYVQEMIMKTLIGFISTLKGIPEDLDNSQIEITFDHK